jgi:hypothetical protein
VHDGRATQSMRVTTDGKNLVSHHGAALLSELADRSGLTEAMSVAMSGCGINWHTHDPGVVLTHLAVVPIRRSSLARSTPLRRTTRGTGRARRRSEQSAVFAEQSPHEECPGPVFEFERRVAT